MKGLSLLFSIFLLLIVGYSSVNAQIGSGAITLTPKDTLICPNQTIRLHGGFSIGATDVNSDDQYGNQILDIGFPFVYYGQTFTQCLYGPNGNLSFDLSNAGTGFTSWVYPTAVGANDLNNCILMPFQDLVLVAGNGGKGSAQVQGVAPFRRFILEICKVPQFSCGTQRVTSQVILYETTNLIEIHLGEQPSCPGWNGGTQIEGLRGPSTGNPNTAPTNLAPGRDQPNVPWTAYNDGRRWTPISATVYKMDTIPYNPSVIIPNADSNSLIWYAQGNPVPLGTGAHIDVTPTANIHYYYAQITGQNGCLGALNYTFQDTVWINYGTAYDTTQVEICAGTTYNWLGRTLYNAGNYDTLLRTVLGCDSFLRLQLKVNPLPVVDVKGPLSFGICQGSPTVLALEQGQTGVTYQWYKDDYPVSGANLFRYETEIAGKYYVIATTNKGCTKKSAIINLVVNPKPEAEILPLSNEIICAYDTLEVTAKKGTNYEYRWSPEKPFRIVSGAEGQKVKGVFIDPTTELVLTVFNEYGCFDTATAIVQTKPCCDVFIPTAFSPNGDAVNDYFNPILEAGQILLNLKVFDRYGKMVYNNENIKKGWNGNYPNGTPGASGVYMYYIKYTCADGKLYEKKESITLIR